jgi:ribonuclease HI
MYLDINKPIFYLFTDASVNPKNNIGYGAYIFINRDQLQSSTQMHHVKTKKFENTSSTKLELETLLWALGEIDSADYKIIIYTDCQNIIGLNDRRARLENNNYMSNTNKLIKNHELYKEFYRMSDILDCEFVKVKGHKKKEKKDEIDRIFTLVDKASRTALRSALF